MLLGKEMLSQFQKDKFVHFFYHVLDVNRDHVISQEDFDDLNDRVRHYMDWTSNDKRFLKLYEIHSLFIQYFLTQAVKFAPKDDGFDFCDFKGPGEEEEEEEKVEEKSSVSIEEWVEVWGETVGKARKMDDLPMWLQYYPKILFDTINRSGTGVITKAATHSPHCVTNYMLELLNICQKYGHWGNVCGGGRRSSSCSTPPSSTRASWATRRCPPSPRSPTPP